MNGVDFSLSAGDIVEDILLRLPVKSLIRFKSVCKTWCFAISNPHFARAHLRRRRLEKPNSFQKLLLIVGEPLEYALKSFNYEDSSNFEMVSNGLLDFPGKFRLPSSIVRIRAHGSCDGLVCLYIREVESHTLILWNPTTGDFKPIPAPTSIFCDFWIVGFGYDPVSDDYKILAVCFDGGREMMIFSLKRPSWRSLGLSVGDSTPSGEGVYLNGFFHWLSALHILSFDLSDEKFKVLISLPDIAVNHGSLLSVVRGCLFVYSGNCEDRCSKCWVWMGEYGVWKEELCDLPCYQGRECLKYAVCDTTDGKVLFHLLDDYKSYGREKHLLCLYSAEDNSSQVATFKNLLSPQMYVESLISP